jgi:hypothetical protein
MMWLEPVLLLILGLVAGLLIGGLLGWRRRSIAAGMIGGGAGGAAGALATMVLYMAFLRSLPQRPPDEFAMQRPVNPPPTYVFWLCFTGGSALGACLLAPVTLWLAGD